MDLFDSIAQKDLVGTPLAEKLRPQDFSEIYGQDKAVAQVEKYLKTKFLPSLIFWGPPGTGKTTLALCISKKINALFVSINATESGAKDLKNIGEKSKDARQMFQQQTVLFVDEIHRFNKAQQDVLLPFVERGDLVLIGATTENPSYELNRALLSRCRIIVFERLEEQNLLQLLDKVLNTTDYKNKNIFTPEALNYFLSWADGDARKLINTTQELIYEDLKIPIDIEFVKSFLGQRVLGHDKSSDLHYDIISAFIKSVRGSDADAALYYLARMLKGGEDPLFISRRLIVLASEDIGNADPKALSVAVAGAQALEMIGLPEGAINIAQVVTYLASAPKSNKSYMGLKKAQEFVEQTGSMAIPLKYRSAKTSEMKNLGYGKGYEYPHDFPKHWTKQNYWPEDIQAQKFYEPSDIGFEKQIKAYLEWLKKD